MEGKTFKLTFAAGRALLATQSHDGVILLNGPELVKLRDAFGVIAKACDKTIEVREIDETAFLQKISFVPEPVAKPLLVTYKEYDAGGDQLYPRHTEAVANVRKLGGEEATKLSALIEGGAKFVFASKSLGPGKADVVHIIVHPLTPPWQALVGEPRPPATTAAAASTHPGVNVNNRYARPLAAASAL
ncbi:hypothetical protein BU23DRAFT_628407 [Bimuria novae-zelandiae CBS 107.79]|uniref:Uncharacterized protein n=1 Tax=Bimuria novae-zelandiae CBS 107.79 TaxID=1447943 RepID=A0A6A5VTT5_9PLEO|nr:hypothetical protein BU23DRAFT_628407 [Bimuria novae-zelandiae CBS 107.79]